MNTSPYAHLPFRPCIGIALLNDEGRIFLGERIDTPGAWQMPQGGIDEGESLEAAARRELREETGTGKADLLHITDTPLFYTLPDDLVPKLWNGRYQGQKQHWAIMRFTGADADINLDFFDPPEFSTWEWAEPNTIINRIVPFKTDIYKNIIDILIKLGL